MGETVEGYGPRGYEPVGVTADVVALTIRDGRLKVLLVERGAPPYQGRRALPGGFVESGRDDQGRVVGESLADAALRELAEETGLRPGHGPLARLHLTQLGAYGDPGRDPRVRIVSVAYLAFAPDLPDPVAGSDATGAEWIALADAVGLAFDHDQILRDGLERARAMLEHTPLATSFVADEFTIAELRDVYAIVWGERLHAGNFHRKVLSVPGFLEGTGGSTVRGGPRGGPRARLYRPGDAKILHPPLLRTARENAIR